MQAQRLYPGFPTPGGMSTGRYSPTQYARTRHCMTNPSFQTNLFGGIDDSIFQHARAEAALMDMKAVSAPGVSGSMMKPGDMFSTYHPAAHLPTTSNPGHSEFHLSDSMMTSSGVIYPSGPVSIDHQHIPAAMASMHPVHQFPQYNHPGFNPIGAGTFVSSALPTAPPPSGLVRYPPGLPAGATTGEPDTDPRELERFAEHFKQRRIKLGVTQADVGKALAHLKMPGVGSLSQSTICRFESLTLSHNNMVALKPILHSWLEKAEEAVKGKEPGDGILPNAEKKRKRTSIAAPEKRSLEAYFAIQPRPSGEKISAISEKLDLKKNVVRVWFCNQRQKQKRWRYSAESAAQDAAIKRELV